MVRNEYIKGRLNVAPVTVMMKSNGMSMARGENNVFDKKSVR